MMAESLNVIRHAWRRQVFVIGLSHLLAKGRALAQSIRCGLCTWM